MKPDSPVGDYLKHMKQCTQELKLNFIQGRPGFCFTNALEFARANPGWLIVHGIVRSPITGKQIVHAWCEFKYGDFWLVHCPSQSNRSPVYRSVDLRDIYYRSACVPFSKRYTLEQATRLGERTGNTGPWHTRLDDHFSKEEPEHIGKNRNGDYVELGRTWVTDSVKGPDHLPMVKKTYVVDGESG